MLVAFAIAEPSTPWVLATKGQNQCESLLLGELVPGHCALDKQLPQVNCRRATGIIFPAFLHDFGDTLLLWLMRPGSPWIITFLVGHNFLPVLFAEATTRLSVSYQVCSIDVILGHRAVACRHACITFRANPIRSLCLRHP